MLPTVQVTKVGLTGAEQVPELTQLRGPASPARVWSGDLQPVWTIPVLGSSPHVLDCLRLDP